MVHSITYVVLHMLSVVRIEPWFKFLSFDLVYIVLHKHGNVLYELKTMDN